MEANSGKWQVAIVSESAQAVDVLDGLQNADHADLDAEMELQRPALQFRATDTAVLVASIAAASSALTALLTGLLQRGMTRSGRHIVIEFASGARLDVPADTRPEDLDRLVGVVTDPPKRIVLP